MNNNPQLEYVNCGLCGNNNTELIYTERGFNIVECSNCGLVYVNPRFKEEEYKEKTNLSYKELVAQSLGMPANTLDKNDIDRQLYIKTRLEESRYNLKEIEKLLKNKGALLDIGCGEGFFLKVAKDSGWQTTGVEMSVNHQPPEEYGLNIITQDFLDASLTKESFNIITLYDVLEHLPKPSEVIKKSKELLKKEGILIIRVPNEKFLRLKMKVIKNIFGKDFYLKNKNLSIQGFYSPETHLFNFNQKTLKAMLQKEGFNILQTKLGKFAIGTGAMRFLIHSLFYYLASITYFLSLGRVNYNCSITVFAQKQ